MLRCYTVYRILIVTNFEHLQIKLIDSYELPKITFLLILFLIIQELVSYLSFNQIIAVLELDVVYLKANTSVCGHTNILHIRQFNFVSSKRFKCKLKRNEVTIIINNSKIPGAIERGHSLSGRMGRKENSHSCGQWRDVKGKDLNTINQKYFKIS